MFKLMTFSTEWDSIQPMFFLIVLMMMIFLSFCATLTAFKSSGTRKFAISHSITDGLMGFLPKRIFDPMALRTLPMKYLCTVGFFIDFSVSLNIDFSFIAFSISFLGISAFWTFRELLRGSFPRFSTRLAFTPLLACSSSLFRLPIRYHTKLTLIVKTIFGGSISVKLTRFFILSTSGTSFLYHFPSLPSLKIQIARQAACLNWGALDKLNTCRASLLRLIYYKGWQGNKKICPYKLPSSPFIIVEKIRTVNLTKVQLCPHF